MLNRFAESWWATGVRLVVRRSHASQGSALRGLAAALVVLVAGCGSDEYEERLQTTAKYYSSIELQNANLHGAWNDPGTKINLRLPLQFAELPPPQPPAEGEAPTTAAPQVRPARPGAGGAPPQAAGQGFPALNPANQEEEGEEGEEAEGDEETGMEVVVDDPRQPQFLNVALPGLRGAFKAPLKVVLGNGQTGLGSGYVYVLTNHHLAGKVDAAARFHLDLQQLLTEAVGVEFKPEDARELSLPQRPDAFLRSITYREVEFIPEEQDSEMAREFGAATQFGLYQHTDGDVQVAILFVLPRDVDNAEKFPSRRTLSLETLKLDSNELVLPESRENAAPVGESTIAF